jgi:hypothetical protein
LWPQKHVLLNTGKMAKDSGCRKWRQSHHGNKTNNWLWTLQFLFPVSLTQRTNLGRSAITKRLLKRPSGGSALGFRQPRNRRLQRQTRQCPIPVRAIVVKSAFCSKSTNDGLTRMKAGPTTDTLYRRWYWRVSRCLPFKHIANLFPSGTWAA